MRYLAIRSHILFASLILLALFGMTLNILTRKNVRVDLTRGKIYSIAEGTEKVLKKLDGPVDVMAFYPHDDPARKNFEVFLKQCQTVHPNLRYNFYDPDRVPNLAKEWSIQEQYTILIRYKSQVERVIYPTEQSFTNALVRVVNPKKFQLCFVTGHGEAALKKKNGTGYSRFREALKNSNFDSEEIILLKDKVPPTCQVVVVAGPHHDFHPDEFSTLSQAFSEGRGILFLIDPMDLGQGKLFQSFFKQFGVELGADVIVDKTSRMIGGDFLIPLVSQYFMHHPITGDFRDPTFYPVSRSVQPAVELPKGFEVIPLALTTTGSWAETNLMNLEKGEANFEQDSDLLGPVPIASAVMSITSQTLSDTPESLMNAATVSNGRMVVVGDSDFLTNQYIELSGNEDFALNTIQWLAKDDRFISLRPRSQEFQPLLLTQKQQWFLIGFFVIGMPLFFLAAGILNLWWRGRPS